MKKIKKKMPCLRTVAQEILGGDELLIFNEHYIQGTDRATMARLLKRDAVELGKIHDKAIGKIKDYMAAFRKAYGIKKPAPAKGGDHVEA